MITGVFELKLENYSIVDVMNYACLFSNAGLSSTKCMNIKAFFQIFRRI